VSRDFGGLQTILMDRLEVPSSSAACLFFLKFTFSYSNSNSKFSAAKAFTVAHSNCFVLCRRSVVHQQV